MSSITGKVNSKGKLAGSVSPSSGVKNYEDLAGLPSINGVQLIGDKTTEDLKLEYVVHVTGDEESGFVADKTNAEINELKKRGFKVTLKVAGRSTIYELFSSSISNAVFQSYIPKAMRIDQVQIMLDNVYIGELDVVPSPTVRGGVKSDPVTESDTVPARYNSEDGRLYVQTYPETPYIVSLTRDEEGNLKASLTHNEILEKLNAGQTVAVKTNIVTLIKSEAASMPNNTLPFLAHHMSSTGNGTNDDLTFVFHILIRIEMGTIDIDAFALSVSKKNVWSLNGTLI